MKLKDRIDSTEGWWDGLLTRLRDSRYTARVAIAVLIIIAILVIATCAK